MHGQPCIKLIRIFVQPPATSSLMVLLLINRCTKIKVRVFICVTFERCSSKIPTRIFCDTLPSNQAAHLANTFSNKEQERKKSAGRRIFSFLRDARDTQTSCKWRDEIYYPVTLPPCVLHSSRHVIVRFNSSEGRQGICFHYASCYLRKTTHLKGSSECRVLWIAILLTAYSLLVDMAVALLAFCTCEAQTDQYCRGTSRCFGVYTARD